MRTYVVYKCLGFSSFYSFSSSLKEPRAAAIEHEAVLEAEESTEKAMEAEDHRSQHDCDPDPDPLQGNHYGSAVTKCGSAVTHCDYAATGIPSSTPLLVLNTVS